MASDTKELIAAAAKELLLEDKVKKLTVKDIVEKAHITRQSFYYHFKDIPDLLRWVLERDSRQIKESRRSSAADEDEFRYFFRLALNIVPEVRRFMETNYAAELKALIDEKIRLMFGQIAAENHLYEGMSAGELDIIGRYHTGAIAGILYSWTAADEQNFDLITHTIYRILIGETVPFRNETQNIP